MATIKNFSDVYTLNTSIISDVFDNDGKLSMLETYGKDMEQVNAISKRNHRLVWTAIDGNNGDILITAGKHWVDRIYYLISNEEWQDDSEIYIDA